MSTSSPNDIHSSAARITVEDSLGIEHASENIAASTGKFNKNIIVNGKEVAKAHTLSQFSKFQKHASSTDRLRCVREVERFTNGQTPGNVNTSGPLPDNAELLVVSDSV
jgi:hypothetical protein